MERKIRHHMAFLATDGDTDMKCRGFISLVNISPSSQSLATRISFTATVGMCYRPKIILYELQMQAALCRATKGLWCAEN